MLAARYKFSPRTVKGFFSRSVRSKKDGYSLLVLPKTGPGSKMAVVLSGKMATTAVKRHAIKRTAYANLRAWVDTEEFAVLEARQPFYLAVMLFDWQRAAPQLRTQDWKETVEYVLERTTRRPTATTV